MIRKGGFAVLSADLNLQDRVARASVVGGCDSVVVDSAGQLGMVLEACAPCAVVVDREHQDADTALRQVAKSPASAILVIRDAAEAPPPGAHVVVFESSLLYALELTRAPVGVVPRLELALGLSLLTGPVDEALESCAHHIAKAFGVERCVISIRGDVGGGQTSEASTWDHLERCRMAVTSTATLIALMAGDAARCESYLAVPLKSRGLLGLVTTVPRIFSREDRATLQTLAMRLGAELGWRGVHDRTADELARRLSGPGLDPLVGIWNHVAMLQLMTMRASATVRAKQALTALVLDVDLRSVNTRYGLKVGDLMLQRVADAVRATVRLEDLVGRWSGDKTLVVLEDATPDGAQHIAEVLQAALAKRPIRLANGADVAIPVAVGIASLQPDEDPSHMVARAAAAAKLAPPLGLAIAEVAPELLPTLQPDLAEQPPVTVAGTYRLRHEISRGAMGVVYRAEDLALERSVAIKMLRPDLVEDREFIERLRTEASLLARIQHPNLVQIYHFGQAGGDSYFVMELIEGEALQDAIARHKKEGTRPSQAVTIGVIEEVASALDALHEHGIIHRDVKPANVIRDPFRGRGVLIDVGIAHRAGQAVAIAGTPGYIAPEVLGGAEATARSDVYGLAATAYAILTLVEPFGEGEAAEILARQNAAVPPAPPSVYLPALAPADAIILAALDRDPARRPASAGELARALASALSVIAPLPRVRTGKTGQPVPSIELKTGQTRGVVFRSVTRVLGVRGTARFQDAIGGEDPGLARALIDTAPLAWLPTTMFARVLALAPQHLDLEPERLARDVARASVRISFRRFFPASAGTLMPERTLSAIRNVWGRYHSWGAISSMPVLGTEALVRLTGTPREVQLCAWTLGMLEQLVVLSGGAEPTVEHETCECRGDDACRFRVRWNRP